MSPSDDEFAIETSREELYDLVWRYPGVVIAKKFRCTEAYLRRVCKALDIPRPARGWWTQGAAGIAVPPPPALPALKHGCPDRWTHGRSVRRWLRHHEVNIFSPQRRLHPLINVAMSIFHGAKQSPDGTHLMPRSDYAIDLTVSAAALDAGLSLANGLFTQFETRKHPVRILRTNEGYIRPDLNTHPRTRPLIGRTRSAVWSPKAPTLAFVYGVPIGLAIIEVRREVLMRYIGDGEFQLASAKKPIYGVTWTECRHVPSHRFRIIAYSPHFPAPWQQEWSETRRKTLVREVAAIVAELEDIAPTLPHADIFIRGASR